MEFLYTLNENTSEAYLKALLLFIASVALLWIFKKFIIRLLNKFSKKTQNKIDDILIKVVRNIKWPFYVLFPFYIAQSSLILPNILEQTIYYAFWFISMYYIVQIVHDTVIFLLEENAKDQGKDSSMISLFSVLIKGVLWFIAIALILANLGYDVTSLIAGLGIGGIAIALAVQNVLSDIFSAFSIYLDKPFEIGDFIKIGADSGNVEKIGIKSTRVRTLQGEELIISNKELTSARIQNFHTLEKRRNLFTLNVSYTTSKDKLEKIPKIIEDIIEPQEYADFGRAHLRDLAESCITFEIVYYALTDNYVLYMDMKQDINLKILDAFQKEGIELAYPTQTIHLEK